MSLCVLPSSTLVLETCVEPPPTPPLAYSKINLVKCDDTSLPISTLWDDFLPNIARLFVDSHIAKIGNMLQDIYFLFDGSYMLNIDQMLRGGEST